MNKRRRYASRPFLARRVAGITVWLLALGVGIAAQNQAGVRYAGRLLSDVLKDLQGQGLKIVYSSELVRPDMRVGTEPRGRSPRQVLDEILRVHGLRAAPGPGGVLLVVRSAQPAPAPVPPPVPATGGVVGQVTDAMSGTPLEQVRIRIEGTDLVTHTDADGGFRFDAVEAGRRRLQVSVVGYIFVEREIDVTAGTVLSLTVPIAEGTGTYTEEVTVTAEAGPSSGSSPAEFTIRSGEIQALGGVLTGDPLRAMQALPAVATGDDFRAEFSVRGSAFRSIGLSLDDITTTALVHTLRAVDDTGSITMLNPDVLEAATLSSSSYPQRFGNHTGAHVAFTTREGSRERTEFHGALSGTNASFVLEGPLGRTRRGSWLATVRQSYLDWLVRKIEPETTSTLGYTDGQAKLVWDVTPAHQVELGVVGGRSRVEEPEENPSLNSLHHAVGRAGLVNVGWRATLGGTLLTQRVYLAGFRFKNISAFDEPLASGERRELGYRADVSHAPATSLILQAGLQLQGVREDRTRISFRPSRPPAGIDPIVVPLEGFAGDATVGSAYGQLRWLGPRGLVLTPGARIDRAPRLAEGTTGSPWLLAEWPFGSFVLRGGTSLRQQFPDIEHANGLHGNGGLVPERAWHGDLSVEQRLGPNARWQVTLYRREERDFLRLPGAEPRLDNGEFVPASLTSRYANVLNGRSEGIEWLVQRRHPNGLSGWASYSFGRLRQTDQSTGETFWGDFDQRHTFNVYAQQRLSDRLSVSGRFRLGSNFPVTGYLAEGHGGLVLTDQRNGARLPVYSRLDLRVNRTFNFASKRLTLFVEVLNVYNRDNYGPTDYSIRVPGFEVHDAVQTLFPILPSAGFLLEF
jgi:hypothetical protein